MKKVLFVCTGNTCRSSMAQAIFENLLSKIGKKDKLQVSSAGLAAMPGMKAADNAIKALKEKGINLSEHKAKQLTESMIKDATLILTMTRNHKQQILSMFPKAEKKVFTIKEFVNKNFGSGQYDDQLASLAARLEEKERNFLSQYGHHLEELQKKKEKLENELTEIEKRINDWHLKLYNYTNQELTELKIFERKKTDLDIPDPFGQPLLNYKRCAAELEELLKKVLEKVADLND